MKIKWALLVGIIIISFVALTWYLGIGGFLASIFESFLILVLSDLDKTMGLLASLCKRGRNIHFWFERNAVEKRLESTINISSRKVNADGVELLPHGVNVRWVEPKGRDAFLKEGEIVVCLESSVNEERNLARATMLYASEDLMRESQRFVDRNVMKSAFFAVARKILMIDRRIDALKCLNEEFLEPEVAQYPSIEKYLGVMEKLDQEGNFTRLLLKELSELGAKLSPALSEPRAEAETRSFMDIMKNLAEKEEGVDVPLDHRGQLIDVSIMLIAREGVKDPTPYLRYAKKCWGEGLPRLYVLARGRCVRVAVAAVLGIRTSGIYRVEKEWKFRIPSKKGGFNGYVAALSRIEK